jgi:hypothetical protein
MKGSGILAAIPQEGLCSRKCGDCFFQGGRSYLQKKDSNDPKDMNLPNMPENLKKWQIVRVNDGNDSNHQKDEVINAIQEYKYENYFYNTSYLNLDVFDAPVVLTLNPSDMTDKCWFYADPIPKKLMMVRIRVNTWNLDNVVLPATEYYALLKIPVILTFMAYNENINKIPKKHLHQYKIAKRTLNDYAVIKTKIWRQIMTYFEDTSYEDYVYSCSKIEGEKGSRQCSRCGNCGREYMNTMERMNRG